MYYPNMITLSPTATIDHYQDALTTLLTARKGQAISVKDSFAVLDLTPYGFRQLFTAQWIVRPASTIIPQQETSTIQWKNIRSEQELLRWEEAWSQTTLSRNLIFQPALLHDANVCFVAAYKEDQIIAGAIGNLTTGVVGISNVFTPDTEAEYYWSGLLNLITASYPALPIVGYEQDENLTHAFNVGFITPGPLSIWLHEG
jgi:hypothetical protein